MSHSTAALASAASSSLLHVAVLPFSAELGDKTFFLALLLTAWCPLPGGRRGAAGVLQQCAVAAGAVAALLARYALVATGRASVGGALDAACGKAALFALGILACFATCELWAAERAPTKGAGLAAGAAAKALVEASAELEDDRGSRRAGGFLGDFRAYDPSACCDSRSSKPYNLVEDDDAQNNPFAAAEPPEFFGAKGYGTQPVTFYQATRKEAWAADVHTWVSPPFAFAIAAVGVFLCESNDKSLQVLLGHGTVHQETFLSVAVGYLPAVVLACFTGFVLERQLSEARLLLVVSLSLFAMLVVAASEVVVAAELSPAELDRGGAAQESFIAPVRSVTRALVQLVSKGSAS